MVLGTQVASKAQEDDPTKEDQADGSITEPDPSDTSLPIVTLEEVLVSILLINAVAEVTDGDSVPQVSHVITKIFEEHIGRVEPMKLVTPSRADEDEETTKQPSLNVIEPVNIGYEKILNDVELATSNASSVEEDFEEVGW